MKEIQKKISSTQMEVFGFLTGDNLEKATLAGLLPLPSDLKTFLETMKLSEAKSLFSVEHCGRRTTTVHLSESITLITFCNPETDAIQSWKKAISQFIINPNETKDYALIYEVGEYVYFHWIQLVRQSRWFGLRTWIEYSYLNVKLRFLSQ